MRCIPADTDEISQDCSRVRGCGQMTVEDLQGNVPERVGESRHGTSHELIALENQLANALLCNEQVVCPHTC
jgi:hypothetical protein